MKNNAKNTGSVIILVVGVLAALALMGSVFLMVTWTDKKESIAINQAAPMRAVAEGQLMRVLAALKDDLFIGDTGPYSSLPTPPGYPDTPDYSDPDYQQQVTDLWKRYIDYPSPDPDHGYDRHLAATEISPADGEYVTRWHWARITNLGDLGLVDVAGWTLNVNPNDPTLVDTDGDGIRDARLFETGVTDRAGNKIFAALRVIDLSGLLNINTAHTYPDYDNDTFMSVGMISAGNLPKEFPTFVEVALGDFQDLQVWQARHATVSWNEYYNSHVRQFDTPTINQSRPFDWSDELACRWLDSINYRNSQFYYGDNPPQVNPLPEINPTPLSRSGRLESALGPDWRRHNRYLTTYSAARNFARPTVEHGPDYDPNTGDPDPWALLDMTKPGPLLSNKVDLNLYFDLLNEYRTDPLVSNPELKAKRDAFDEYRRAFYHMLPHLNGDRKQVACQMAVNLIDFQDVDYDDNGNVVHTPTVINLDLPRYQDLGMSGGRIFGVERQPFISQAWTKLVRAPIVGSDPVAYESTEEYAALVIRNPYSEPISLQGWTVTAGAATHTIGNVVLDSGERFVLHGKSEFATDTINIVADTSVKREEFSDPARPTESLSFEQGVKLFRPGITWDNDDDNPQLVNIDDVPTGLVEHDDIFVGANLDIDGTVICNIGRDDNPAHFRLSVTRWTVMDETDYTAEEIGGSTLVDDSALDKTAVYVRNSPFVSVGDLTRILHIGPNDDGTPLDDQLIDDTTGRLHSLQFNDHGIPGVPNVPPICLAADFFTIETGKTWGRININTAPVATLATFFWGVPHSERLMIAGNVVAYREMLEQFEYEPGQSTWRDYVQHGREHPDLRSQAGFASAGEVAVILRPPVKEAVPPSLIYSFNGRYDGYASGLNDDLVAQEIRFAYAANQLTVNSDVYGVYIRVQVGDNPDADNARYYFAVVDRSNVTSSGDQPIIRMFAEVKQQ